MNSNEFGKVLCGSTRKWRMQVWMPNRYGEIRLVVERQTTRLPSVSCTRLYWIVVCKLNRIGKLKRAVPGIYMRKFHNSSRIAVHTAHTHCTYSHPQESVSSLKPDYGIACKQFPMRISAINHSTRISWFQDSVTCGDWVKFAHFNSRCKKRTHYYLRFNEAMLSGSIRFGERSRNWVKRAKTNTKTEKTKGTSAVPSMDDDNHTDPVQQSNGNRDSSRIVKMKN